MSKTFRPFDRDQMLLMPPSVADWVPEDHLARFVGDLVETLDLRAIEETYLEERGYPPYHPRMMVAMLLYAYCTGTYSSRKIAAKLVDSVAFRYLPAGNTPDFRTISEFRKRHGVALAGLFTQSLRLCRQASLVKLGRVAVDGTKIKANASKHKAMSYGRMREKEAALAGEVADLLRQADAADREEDRRYGADQDYVAWVGQGTVADRTQEHVGESDRGVILMRRKLLEQAELVARGGEPLAVVRDADRNRWITMPIINRDRFVKGAPRASFKEASSTPGAFLPDGFPFVAGQPEEIRKAYRRAMGLD